MPLIQVRQSAVHGRGVFAARSIRKGRRIIEYTGRRVAWKSIPADVNGAHTFLFGINDGTDVKDKDLLAQFAAANNAAPQGTFSRLLNSSFLLLPLSGLHAPSFPLSSLKFPNLDSTL